MMGNRSVLTLGQVSGADGTSNTIMYGESCGQFHPSFGKHAFDMCWLGVGAISSVRGMAQGQDARIMQFSSNHSGGVVQYCMGDGSVKLLRIGATGTSGSPDWTVFQQIAGYNDGSAADTSAIMN
jgi:prepilin-type processing-associated H-X9-DG protein